MGNIIGSPDEEEINSLRGNTLRQKGISHTAMGRHSTPQLKKKSNIDGIRKNHRNEICKSEFNSKIYRDIFPPKKSSNDRNTIGAMIYFGDISKGNNQNNIGSNLGSNNRESLQLNIMRNSMPVQVNNSNKENNNENNNENVKLNLYANSNNNMHNSDLENNLNNEIIKESEPDAENEENINYVSNTEDNLNDSPNTENIPIPNTENIPNPNTENIPNAIPNEIPNDDPLTTTTNLNDMTFLNNTTAPNEDFTLHNPQLNNNTLDNTDTNINSISSIKNSQYSSTSGYNANANASAYNEYELNWGKSGEDLRRSYIAKLIYKKVWQPTIKEKDHNTLIIFDWDDTLLCTSFLTPNGIFLEDTKISEKDMEKIKKLEISASNILKRAILKGDTYIITNAAPGWVEYSAGRFYPEVKKLLNKVTIVSARGEYEKKHPGDSRQWKILAFLEMLNKLDSNLVTNLICLGDSIIEMEAAHILASKFSHAYIKTIKFRESPKPEELNKQLHLVIDQFDKIFSSIKNLTIRVEKKSRGNDGRK